MLEQIDTLVQYDTHASGIHLFTFHESSASAVLEWANITVEMLAAQSHTPDVARWLMRISQPGMPPFDEVIEPTHRFHAHTRRIGAKLRIAYLTDSTTFQILLPSVNHMLGRQTHAKWYNCTLDHYDHYHAAVDWLLAE